MKRISRSTDQFEMPARPLGRPIKATYNIFPDFELEQGTIHEGFEALARELTAHPRISIDGYTGVDWNYVIGELSECFDQMEVSVKWISTQKFFKAEATIESLVMPYLGGDDPVFGKRYPGSLSDFLIESNIESEIDSDKCCIVYGPGAQLVLPEALICYIDIPKNEIQYRSRAGEVLNLGMTRAIPPKAQYKRMYFVDWPILNRHKEAILPKIDIMIDDQFSEQLTWCTGETFRTGLVSMSQHAFRVRPWFEPGVWGGDWILNRIEGLNRDVVNYAWSFECIVPENGIVMKKNGIRLECSFDFLMYSDARAILGDAAQVFGTEFPIRFDFLDTFNGQNLSLQCHPTPDFIRTEFGETFTQDETYYMLDAAPDAKVYLGFQEEIEPSHFEAELKRSVQSGEPMDVERYVQVHHAKKHDLFLIPHGTVHCSGKNGLVLEISSTPYIFTFKMYDWMRLDLDGNPRPLNIDRAMKNLDFSCKGSTVNEEYISTQKIIDEGPDWQVYHLSTHPKHFYEVHRIEFCTEYVLKDNDKGHVMSLVEGNQIEVVTKNRSMLVNYAETFIVPAAAEQIVFRNKGMASAKIIRASVKPDFNLL